MQDGTVRRCDTQERALGHSSNESIEFLVEPYSTMRTVAT